MKLEVAICDDDSIIREELLKKISILRTDYHVETFRSGIDLLQSPLGYDLIFLDIEMPEVNGMQVASKLREMKFDGYIIFLTSHTEYMPDAFKVKAFRFLKKPVNDDDFEETIRESEKEILNEKKIIVTTSEGTKLVDIKDVIYLETVRNTTFIVTKQGEIENRKPLKEMLKILGTEHFIQVHKSYAVALRYIDSIDNNEINMKYTKLQIPVSRRKISEVKSAFFDYARKYALYM